ncbi:heme lyase NrfEFG subunit NrfF [Pasteurella sp. PK-2025]|uniref:heme lyase NrfEFG subunit NrfF n=1 Tax=unclassified Pasteurella TaxID=2621516 RepID=UPI003C72A98F
MRKCGRFLLSLSVLISVLMSLFAQAEIVDTYVFHSAEARVRAVELAKSLRCPQCQNQNLVESNSPLAADLRLEVYNMVNEGKSNQDIVAVMTDRFGDFVLYQPPFQWTTLFLWCTPVLLLLLALGLMWRETKGKHQPHASLELDPTQQAALQQLLKQGEKTGNEK